MIKKILGMIGLISILGINSGFTQTESAVRPVTEGYLPAYHAIQRQDYLTAASYLRTLIQQNTDLNIRSLYFQALVQIGDLDQAVGQIEQLRQQKVDFPLLHLLAGVHNLSNKVAGQRNVIADAEFKSLGNQTDQFYQAFTQFLLLWQTVIELEQLSQPQTDLKIFEQKLQQISQRQGLAEFYWLNLGMIADLLNQPAQAEIYYKQLLQTVPNPSLRTLEIVGVFYAKTAPQANPILNILQRQYVEFNNDQRILELVKLFQNPGSLPSKIIQSGQQGMAEIFFNFANIMSSQQEYTQAIPLYWMSLKLNSNLTVARLGLAMNLVEMERYEEARTILSQLLAPNYLTPSARIQLADIDQRQGQLEQALAAFQGMAQQYPDWILLHQAAGDVLRSQKKFEQALPFYQQALVLLEANLKTVPGSVSLKNQIAGQYFVLGIAYERTKQWPKAEASFLKSLALQPQQAPVMNYLAYTWVDQGIKLDQALEMLLQADRLTPNQGYILDSIGWAYYRLKQYDKAIQYMEKAIVLDPGEAEINDHLGDVYLAVGRKREALFQWQRALRLNPQPETIPLIQEKILKLGQP